MAQDLPAVPCLAHDHDQEAPRTMITGEAVEGGGIKETGDQGEEEGRGREERKCVCQY